MVTGVRNACDAAMLYLVFCTWDDGDEVLQMPVIIHAAMWDDGVPKTVISHVG